MFVGSKRMSGSRATPKPHCLFVPRSCFKFDLGNLKYLKKPKKCKCN